MNMMEPEIMSFLKEQLIYRLPVLLVAFTGFGLSLSYFRHYPRPAALVCTSSLILLSLNVAMPIAYFFLMKQDWEFEQMDLWFKVLGGVNSCLEGVALSLLVWAAFAHRRHYFPPEYFESGGREDYLRNE